MAAEARAQLAASGAAALFVLTLLLPLLQASALSPALAEPGQGSTWNQAQLERGWVRQGQDQVGSGSSIECVRGRPKLAVLSVSA